MSTRYTSLIGLRPEMAEEYLRLHRDVPEAVERRLRDSNVRDLRIFHRELAEGKQILVMTYDYVGTDHAADMRLVAEDPATQEWWKLTDPCQYPLVDPAGGEWWAATTEVCRLVAPGAF
jgi:L-rhamnose mutarotase